MNITFNPDATNKLFRILVLLVMALMLFKAILLGIKVDEKLIVGDNDDMMRLLSVRDWLGGQSWFDMRQYRMVPPEGLDLHWSRYLDAAIAIVLWPLMQVLPVDMAEYATLIIWPTLLLIILAAITAMVGRKTLGPMAGVAALFCLVLLPYGAGALSEEDVKAYSTDIRNLVGDCAVAAAFLSYAGPFPSEYREKLVSRWLDSEIPPRPIPRLHIAASRPTREVLRSALPRSRRSVRVLEINSRNLVRSPNDLHWTL